MLAAQMFRAVVAYWTVVAGVLGLRSLPVDVFPDLDKPTVVVLSNGDEGEKAICLGENYGNKSWRDFLGNREETVTTAADGEGTFTCNGGSVSIWVMEDVL